MKELEEQLGLEAAEGIQAMDERHGAENKPQVVLHGGSTTITATAQAIAEAVAPAERLFARGGSVWHLLEEEDGVWKLDPVNPAKARSLFEDYCRPATPR